MTECHRKLIFIGFLILFPIKLVSQNTVSELSSKYSHFQTLPDKEKFTEEYVKLLNDFAQYYRFRNADSLNFYAIKALEVSKKIDFKEGLVTAKIRVGDYYTDIENPIEAEKKYLKAKKIIQVSNNPKLKVSLLRSLSLFYLFNRRLKEGITSSYDAIAISRKNSFTEMESVIRHNLGFIYWSNNLYEEAKIEYLIADSLSTSLNNSMSSAKTKSNLGLNAICLNDLESAEKYITKSFKVFEENNDILWMSRNSRVKSEYFNAIQNYDKALHWVKKSDSLLRLAYNTRDELLVLESYCNIFFKTKKINALKDYSKKLLHLAEQFNDKKQIQNSFYYLKEAEYLDGNLNKMVSYNRAYDSLQNLIYEDGKDNNLKFLRAKLEYEQEQLLTKSENDKKLDRQRNITLMIVFALIISLLLGALIRQNYVMQKKAHINLKQVNDTKDKIFSIVGHDLQTPLSTLKELLELLEEKVISPKEMVELTPKVKRNLDYSTFTLNNLLYWAQSQMKNIRANPSQFDAKNIIDDTIAIFEMEAGKKQIKIENLIVKKCPVIFDFEHLRIIFRNLINNAIKFTPDNGTITIKSEVYDNHLLLSVCDTGIGFTDKSISDCLDPDVVFTTKGTNNEKGTGLGLALCKDLAHKNNCEITVEQNHPIGSCFQLKIRE